LAAAGSLAFLVPALILLQSQWELEDSISRLMLVLFCLCGGMALAGWAQKISGPPSTTVTGELMLIVEPLVLVLFARFLREHRVSWAEAFGLTNGRGRAALLGIMVGCLFLPIGQGLQWLSAATMLRVHLHPHEQEVVQTLRVSSAWLNRLSLGIVAIVLAPIVEEISFRGILYPAIKQAGFPRLALWGSALLFACMHFNLMTFVPLLFLAVVLTALYEYTNNLLAPMTAHALFNALNFVLLYVSERSIPSST
jgi:membrane protease YdiL (CAAX protease family)